MQPLIMIRKQCTSYIIYPSQNFNNLLAVKCHTVYNKAFKIWKIIIRIFVSIGELPLQYKIQAKV